MTKVAVRYLEVDPWRVIENSFHPDQSRVSESIFSLGNEYMGVRGYFDEGYSGDRLVGSYFNGFYEESAIAQPSSYKGMLSRTRFMVNTVDWLYTRICLDGESLDLARSTVTHFQRVLDFRTGMLQREFVWNTAGGKSLKVSFLRFVSMADLHLAWQHITLTPLNFSGAVELECGLDFSPLHEGKKLNFWDCPIRKMENGVTAIFGKTTNLGQPLFSGFHLQTDVKTSPRLVEGEKYIGQELVLNLEAGTPVAVNKVITNYAAQGPEINTTEVWRQGMKLAENNRFLGFITAKEAHIAYWSQVWNHLDITIDGDPENQQGIRFCIFQLHQTYHGANPGSNIGAKGLTGEAYNGHTFWDTETYCLPFYMFNNPHAARNLLEFRYRTLPQARERAQTLDCRGAFYPIATIDGTESCDLWQHANLQLQVGTAVAYGIWHYVKICLDFDFLHRQGMEILVEICRCFASRGGWGAKTGKFGFYGVMGPDEFQIMVNNNFYLNYMAKKTFEYTLQTLVEMKTTCPDLLEELIRKTKLEPGEPADWDRIAAEMYLPQDPVTQVFEQHDGFFNMPHIDVGKIPAADFPLYHNWSYDRIYRYDMIKQPDVLMFIFLHNQEFSDTVKRANYEYYEPRCIHESSLSPSIHSILAAELGYHEQAFDFCRFATRLDLDNYNRNTHEGLHTTSIAAAWMNIVYGFGGMRSDGAKLTFRPSIPKAWNSYDFHLLYRGSTLKVRIDQEMTEFTVTDGPPVLVQVYGVDYRIDSDGVKIKIPDRGRGRANTGPAEKFVS
ncbi:MAG TPA: glycosyl hydrolase family 65 protein [Bacillota bacterium]|nr:glycosyl hydrolase family 65 protein [Bacillota bacterium]